jgi:hypothetical protein
MKKHYEKPTLTRRENIRRITAQQNGDALAGSPGVRPPDTNGVEGGEII